MTKEIKGGLAVLGLCAVAGAVGFLFTRDMEHFSGKAARSAQTKGAGVAEAAAAPAGGSAIGSYYGKPFSRESLTSGERMKLFEAEQQMYSAYEELLVRRYMDEFFERYRTEKKLPSVEAARDAFIKSKINIPEDRVKAIVEQYKDNERLKGLPHEQQLKEVRMALEAQDRQRVMQQFVAEGREKGEFAMVMPKPVEPRVDLDDGGNYFMGPKDAKVTIVEFADYQCPFCARMVPTLKDLVKKYDGKVRWVYRDFPLDFHPQAAPSAVAASCAGKQGKYFEAHGILFDNHAKLGEEVYAKVADELKLDKAKYEECRKDPAVKAEVQKDYEVGMELGVNGTPAYFVNGRKFSGGMSPADFARVIDEELARN